MIHAGMRIVLPGNISVERAGQIADQVLKSIHEKDDPGYCFIQLEPGNTELEQKETIGGGNGSKSI
jgi:divalent metal cation (Fe/Co/Zn/Cd) transporter